MDHYSNYITIPCGGGFFHYGGFRAEGVIASVSFSGMTFTDTRGGHSQAPFVDVQVGEGLVGGYGVASFSPIEEERFVSLGVGDDIGITSAEVNIFEAHDSTNSIFQNSEGLGLDLSWLSFQGGVGVYYNTDSVTSCIDHGGW